MFSIVTKNDFRKLMKLFNQQDSIDSENSRNTTRFNKNNKERAREIQGTTDLSWFTLPQGLHPVPYTTVRISTIKRSNQINLQKTTCTPQVNIAPRSKQSAEPTAEPRTIHTPLYKLENPLLIPSASHNLYRTHYTKQTTNPGNSQQNNLQYSERIITFQQYKHFYTTDYKSNKETVQKAQSDDQISEEIVSVKSKLQQQFKKIVLDKNVD